MNYNITNQTRLLTNSEVIIIRSEFNKQPDIIKANSFLELLDKVNDIG